MYAYEYCAPEHFAGDNAINHTSRNQRYPAILRFVLVGRSSQTQPRRSRGFFCDGVRDDRRVKGGRAPNPPAGFRIRRADRADRPGIGAIAILLPMVFEAEHEGGRHDILLFHQLSAVHDDCVGHRRVLLSKPVLSCGSAERGQTAVRPRHLRRP